MRMPLPTARRAVDLARGFAATIAVILAVGGIPGGRLQAVLDEFAVPVPPTLPLDTKDRDGAVDVTVHSGVGGPPLAGAHVRALSMIDDLVRVESSTDTDQAGRARLEKLPLGVIWILVDSPGRARASTRLVVDPTRGAVTVDLDPEHVIVVSVKDEGGSAIAGAEIEVVGTADLLPVGARTGADGIARVGRLGVGPWRVTARAPSYEEASGRAAGDGDTASIVLHKLGSLTVHVVAGADADRGIAGARVSVAGAMLWPAREGETDGRGDIRIEGLTEGVYALRASRGDLVSGIELGVALGHGEDKSVMLRMAAGRWVGVRVTDGDSEDARAIGAARVVLAEGGLSPFPIEATTDASGRARLGPIAAGEATLSVRASGFVPRGAILLAEPPTGETRVALVRSGAVSGRVVDDRGYPIDGATIQIVGTDPNGAPILDDPRRTSFQAAHFDAMLGGPAPLIAAGELGVMPGTVPPIPPSARFIPRSPIAPVDFQPWVTRADGTFRASPASPGRLRVIVRHPQFVEGESDQVTLTPGGEAEIEIVMHAGGALEGRVVDAHNRPVEGARVYVSATRGSLERAARTAKDGGFAFSALPRVVTLTASAEGEDQAIARMTVEVPEATRQEVTVQLPEPRRPLAVTVVDAHDWPIAAAQVTASALIADTMLRTTSFTDAHGDALLKQAMGLPLRIEASAPGHAPRAVTVDGSSDAVRIELAPSETATGTVISARRGDPIEGADVTLYTDSGVRRARTDAHGAFALRELAPGGGRLQVTAPGFAGVSLSAVVPDSAGERAFVVPPIELAREGVIEGDVVDAHGDPVAGARVARDHAPTWLVVGVRPEGVAVTDAKGRFAVGGLSEGTVALEAYAPDLGRGRVEAVRVVAERTTSNVHIALTAPGAEEDRVHGPTAPGSIAVTLGETGAPVQIVLVSVGAASEAERAGLAPGDVLLAVNEAPVHSIEEARDRLSGPLSDDVVVRVKRGEQEFAVRVSREAVRR
jgi:hypothetical protein